MSKIMLIGGAGFIGSYITRELVKRGKDEVVIYDNFVNYVHPFDSRYYEDLHIRFEDLKKDVTIVRGDIRSKINLLNAVQEHRPSKIVNLAAIPDALITNTFPEDGVDINLMGHINVLEVLRKIGFIDKFIFSSSSFVYGDFEGEIADETRPTSPICVYGATKLASETLTKAYSRRYGLPYTIIRPCAVYGPGDTHGRVTKLFVENALNKKPLILHDGGVDKIDFTYVSDIAHGFVLALDSEKAYGETFNITAGNARSIKEFADIVKKHIPEAEIVEKSRDYRVPKRSTISIEKARKLLGYEPKVQIEDGIPKYIEGLRENKIVV